MAPRQADAPVDFDWQQDLEPHVVRRKKILEKYPEIKDLYGYCPKEKYMVFAMIAVQAVGIYLARDAPWGWLIFFSWAISGTINHSLSLAVHELSHGLMFRSLKANVALGMCCNLTQGVPSSVTFKRYHMEHHLFQGVDGVDTDIPTEMECKVFRTALGKFIFLLMQPFAYALRPMFVRPKAPQRAELINQVIVFSFDALVLYFLGGKSLFYMVGGTLLGMGVHPVAGHFISEHYVFTKGKETYSYYGPLNAISFNVGYHNEHHDFPRVAGTNLPKIRAIAPEFYENLPHYDSWMRVLYDFVMNPEMSLYSRVKRPQKTMPSCKTTHE